LTRTILAFGDSLTWGVDPGRGRHAQEDRWPAVLERLLPDTRVIPEGLPGRTTAFDDANGAADRNGARILPVLLGSHYPLDLVVILLGANDLKQDICGHAAGAAGGMARLVEIVRTFPYDYGYTAPQILLVSPPHFRIPDNGALRGGRLVEESKKLADHYRAVADENGCGFFDTAVTAQTCSFDGIHLDAKNTRQIGIGVAGFIRLTYC
jgi:lysophospholipase L1-like esterase